jgi:hypothetical protein
MNNINKNMYIIYKKCDASYGVNLKIYIIYKKEPKKNKNVSKNFKRHFEVQDELFRRGIEK